LREGLSANAVNCQICGCGYRRGYFHNHLKSYTHKLAVIEASKSDHPIYGTVVTSSRNGKYLDVVFPSYDDYFKQLDQYESKLNSESTLSANVSTPLNDSVITDKHTDKPVEFSEQNCSDRKKHESNLKAIADFVRFYQKGIDFRINKSIIDLNNVKVNINLNMVLFKIPADGTEYLYQSFGICSKTCEIHPSTDVNEWLEAKLIKELQARYDESSHVGSNWSLFSFVDLKLTISAYTPLSASSFVPLPKFIADKKAVINVQNDDQKCFFYSIACKFLDKSIQHKERVTHFKPDIMNKVDFTGLNLNGPTSIKEISIFEKNNKASVNVYALTENKKKPIVYPLRIAKVFYETNHWDLLYLTEGEKNHFCYINKFTQLVSMQKLGYRAGNSIHICRCCLQHFFTESRLKTHIEYCYRFKPVKVMMPQKDACIEWNKEKYKMKEKVPYVIYADFETALRPINDNEPTNCNSYTHKKHYHDPSSFCFQIVTHNADDNTEYYPFLYRGANAVKKFWKKIREEVNKISAIYDKIKPMAITPAQRSELINTPNPMCHICEKIIEERGEMVIDHCHLTGRVRGLSHNECNLVYRLPYFVPIILHNGSNYDFKLLVSEIVSEAEASSYCSEKGSRKNKVETKKKRVQKRKEKKKENIFVDNEAEVEDGSTEGSEGESEQWSDGMDEFIDDRSEEECEEMLINPYRSSESEDENTYRDDDDCSQASSMIGATRFRNNRRILESDDDEVSKSDNDESLQSNIAKPDRDDDDVWSQASSIIRAPRSRNSKRIRVLESDNEEDEKQSPSFGDRSLREDIAFESSKPKVNESSYRSKSRIQVIATSTENFISFQVPITKRLSVRFLDSFRFLSQSLSSLASLLEKSEMKFVRKFYNSSEEFDIASRKGVFPYEYISDLSKYEETDLPPKECFYNTLSGCNISDEEYEFAKRVWRICEGRRGSQQPK
jgi:hypothetical protein